MDLIASYKPQTTKTARSTVFFEVLVHRCLPVENEQHVTYRAQRTVRLSNQELETLHALAGANAYFRPLVTGGIATNDSSWITRISILLNQCELSQEDLSMQTVRLVPLKEHTLSSDIHAHQGRCHFPTKLPFPPFV